jgi:membrane protein involved in colicin uptake
MFEDTLVESSAKSPDEKGRTVAVSALLHAVLIAVLIFVPARFYQFR